MAAVAIEAPTTCDGTPAQQKIAAAGSSIGRALDCQTFIVSLFTKGREVCGYTHAQEQLSRRERERGRKKKKKSALV